jgi:hypothetical protein
MARVERSGGTAGFLPAKVGLDIFQEIVEVWPVGKALFGKRHAGVPDQPAGIGAPSLAVFTTGLMQIFGSSSSGVALLAQSWRLERVHHLARNISRES